MKRMYGRRALVLLATLAAGCSAAGAAPEQTGTAAQALYQNVQKTMPSDVFIGDIKRQVGSDDAKFGFDSDQLVITLGSKVIRVNLPPVTFNPPDPFAQATAIVTNIYNTSPLAITWGTATRIDQAHGNATVTRGVINVDVTLHADAWVHSAAMLQPDGHIVFDAITAHLEISWDGDVTARSEGQLMLSAAQVGITHHVESCGGTGWCDDAMDSLIPDMRSQFESIFQSNAPELFGGSLGGIPQMLTTWFNIQLDLPWQNDGTPWTIDTQSISFHTDGVAVTGYRNTKPLGPPAGCTLVAICGPQVEAQCDSMRAGEHLVLRRLAAAGNAINVPYTPQNQDNLLGHSYAYDPGVSPSQSYQYLACITSDPNKPDYTDCTPSPLSVTVSQGACSVGGGGGPNCGVPGKPKCNSVGIDPTPP